MKKNLIIRISNELGNQLFMYASAYGISKEINRDLFIDDTTAYDSNKNISKYALNNFNISSEVASGNLKFQSLSGYIKRKLLIKTDFLRKRKLYHQNFIMTLKEAGILIKLPKLRSIILLG